MSRKRKVKQLEPKKNKKKKKHSRVFLYVFLSFFAVSLFVTLSLTVFFPVKNIEVSGKSKYDAQQIIDISGIEIGQNLILTSEEKVSSLITKNLPYISEVKIKKKLPSTVILVVKKAKKIAQFETKSGYILCDENKKVLEITKKAKKNIPIIRGVRSNDKISVGTDLKSQKDTFGAKLDVLDDILNFASAEGIDKITVIKIKSINDVNITYDDRIVLQCGSSNNLDLKMKYAKRVLAEKEHGEQSGILNLSRIPSEKQQAYFTACELSEEQISYSLEEKNKKTKK